jgi:hypothetical protein
VHRLLLPVLLLELGTCHLAASALGSQHRVQQWVRVLLLLLQLVVEMVVVLCSWQGLQSPRMITSMRAQQQPQHR